jgi:uncharacterized OB-fold protein
MTVTFRDRALKKGEHSHYVCDQCGAELHPDMAYSHKCSMVTFGWSGYKRQYCNPMQDQYTNKLWQS